MPCLSCPPPQPPAFSSWRLRSNNSGHGGVPGRLGASILPFLDYLKFQKRGQRARHREIFLWFQRAPHPATKWEAMAGEKGGAERMLDSIPGPSRGQKAAVPASVAGFGGKWLCPWCLPTPSWAQSGPRKHLDCAWCGGRGVGCCLSDYNPVQSSLLWERHPPLKEGDWVE